MTWIVFSFIFLIGVALLCYLFVFRGWMLTWGTTAAERRQILPGDAFLPGARSVVTRGITIDAPPERVWPWLAQIGQNKGGFYSYAWLENLFGCEIVNAQAIHPEWQRIERGDQVRLHPKMGMPVMIVDQNHALVLGANGIPEQHIPPTTWAFILEPAIGHGTRFLVRWRSATPKSLYDLVFNKYLLEPFHFTMERKMMLGLRQRAEACCGEN